METIINVGIWRERHIYIYVHATHLQIFVFRIFKGLGFSVQVLGEIKGLRVGCVFAV